MIEELAFVARCARHHNVDDEGPPAPRACAPIMPALRRIDADTRRRVATGHPCVSVWDLGSMRRNYQNDYTPGTRPVYPATSSASRVAVRRRKAVLTQQD